MLFQSTRLANRSLQRGSLGPRLLRMEPLEERRLLTARAVEAVNLFAMDVYEQLQREEGNLFFSPLSISAALAMTYAGAAGQTASEMEQVLHLGAEPGIHDSYNALFNSFDTQSNTIDDYELSLANVIWPQLGLPLQSNFVNTIETDYRGYVQGLDFANPELAEEIINAWVEAQTHGRIQDLVDDLDPDTAMILTNTIYFKGLWDSPFDPRYTTMSSFTRSTEDEVQVSMMFRLMFVAHTQLDGFEIVDLRLADGAASMVLILPTQQDHPNNLTSELLTEIDSWFDGPREYLELDVYLPKFQIEVDTSLNELLIGLGMPTVFSGAADFSNMTASPVFIKKVFHKALVEVNEQGTEAAAATEVHPAACFAAGTPVLTPDSEKPIEQLQVGDIVLARDEHNIEGELQLKVILETSYGHSEVLELHVRGRIIRTTELHPFFVRGRGWTPAGKLKVDDHLSTDRGDWARVDKVVENGTTEPVYNLRVADHHTYFVGSKTWKFAVWTHNFYDGEFIVDHPFHFIIRDNTTSTITFMGRIDDPTQLSNSLNPTFQLDNSDYGDYNHDDHVDSEDYQAWRAAFGQMGDSLPADGNDNNVVDITDYVLWRDNLGRSLAPPSPASGSESGPMPAELAAENLEETALDAPVAPAIEITRGSATTPAIATAVPNSDSSSQRPRAAHSRSRLPIVQISDDDLLLLAAAPATPAATADVVNVKRTSEAINYQSSTDEVFAELGDKADVWDRVALGL